MTTREFLKKEAPALLLVVLPFLALPFIWNRVPDQVPLHWNIRGEIDSYGSKTWGLLAIPLVNVGIYLLFWLVPKIDPKRKVGWHRKPLPALRFFLLLSFTLLFVILVAGMMEPEVFNTSRLVPLAILVLLLAMGNYMATVQPNYFIGIRTPWTLEDPEVWRKTHRMGGRLWVVLSALLIVLWLVMPVTSFYSVFLVGVGIMALVPIVYSYVLYARKKPEEA